LTRLLDDPQINVRTMAFEGLAERKDKGAVKEILQRLKCSEDWYGQMYAYKALKALGWDQGLPH
jgi:HEAT repeat protein